MQPTPTAYCLQTKMAAVEAVERDENCMEKQQARAFMRERFLRVMTGVSGQKCEFDLYERTSVSAELRACDRDVMHLCVTNLKTPLGVVPQSVLRTRDILSVHVPELPSKT